MRDERSPAWPRGGPAWGRDTVLLVERDIVRRRIGRVRLGQAGFRVLEAPDPEAAMVILTLRQDVLVVVTDVELPGAASCVAADESLGARFDWIAVVRTSMFASPRGLGTALLHEAVVDERLVKVVEAAAAAARQLRRAAPPAARLHA